MDRVHLNIGTSYDLRGDVNGSSRCLHSILPSLRGLHLFDFCYSLRALRVQNVFCKVSILNCGDIMRKCICFLRVGQEAGCRPPFSFTSSAVQNVP